MLIAFMRRRGLALGLYGLTLAAIPAHSQGNWNQAYGNIGNTSFVNIQTSIGTRPRWSFDLHAPVEWSGPAVGPDGTVYVGTAIGTFYGVRSDGTGRCAWSFAGGTFVSTPAILPDGTIAMLLHRKEGERKQAELHLISPDCEPVWNRDLPRWSQNHTSLASGSVKVWTNPDGQTFLFVHSRGSRQIDLTRKEANTGNEILVFDAAGELFARSPTGSGCAELRGSGLDFSFGDVWDFFGGLWPTVGELPPLFEQFGWPDPSPALLDSTVRGFSTAFQPLVAVTDHDCNSELNTYQFRPEAATVEDRLVRTWTKSIDSRGTQLSSPALLLEGKVVVGSSTNRLRVYDLPSQSLSWEKDTKEAVMHPPAMTPTHWYAMADYWGWIFTPSGALASTVRPLPRHQEGTVGGTAASLNQAFIPNFEGLEIWSPTLQALVHPLQDERFRTTSPALTQNGGLYVVSQTESNSILFAFGNP